MKRIFLVAVILLFSIFSRALDSSYHYSIDLREIADRKLPVTLIVPTLSEEKPIFSLPKIVPGTYSIYDFGRFLEDFKAFDAAGKQLEVVKLDTNSWQISSFGKLAKITYQVHDSYHDNRKNNPIFEPAGTDFEPDTCYVLNLHTFIGYFRGHTKQPYELNISHRYGFFPATSLDDFAINQNSERFLIANYNDAIDNPIMYTVPDTVHIKVGESDVLVSVYSPGHRATAHGIAAYIDTLLQAQGKYLGGKLPVKKYSFLIYLADRAGMGGGFGALEHSYSSMYYLIDGSDASLAPTIRDVSAHEFFHIVTPLNIHSEEIANFDFDKPKMSEHLWLYEGSTEYHAHAVQVRYGLISPREYLTVIKQKITEAKFGFNDSLSFTCMSRGCLDTFKDQYNNVYSKGMLISMCLDLKLLHLSDGKYGLMHLIHDLEKTYGKDKSFNDEELIPKIVSLTYPEIQLFFDNYVIGGKPLPFAEMLRYAGVEFIPVKISKAFSFGGASIGYNAKEKKLMIVGIDNLNDFGREMGYQKGDVILKINGKEIAPQELLEFRQNWIETVKEGDKLSLIVERKDSASNTTNKVTLSGKVVKADTKSYNEIFYTDEPTEAQLKIKNVWLRAN